MPVARKIADNDDGKPLVVEWLLDTRNLWPEAESTQDLCTVASRTFAVMSPDERAKALRYVNVRDAKLSVVSSLLKRLAISRLCSVSWAAATAVSDRAVRCGKPGFPGIEFNVSHQAGIVALVAAVVRPPAGGDEERENIKSKIETQPPSGEEAAAGSPIGVGVGVDVVCTAERRNRDHKTIAEEGWPHFVAIHSGVLSAREAQRLRDLEATADRDACLRAFYALWCLREAYIKMTGDALLASWLPWLEFLNFRAPDPLPPAPERLRTTPASPHPPPGRTAAPPEMLPPDPTLLGGEEVTGDEVGLVFQGQPVVTTGNVALSLRPVEDSFMVCSVVRMEDGATQAAVGRFRWLSVDDVLLCAEQGLGGADGFTQT